MNTFKYISGAAALVLSIGLLSAHAEKLDTASTHVDAPPDGIVKPHIRPYGQQMAMWQKQQLEQEKEYLAKAKTEHRMEAVRAEKGTVENVHPLMSKVSPRLNFN